MVDDITNRKNKDSKKKKEASDPDDSFDYDEEDIHTFNHVSKYYDENYYNEE